MTDFRTSCLGTCNPTQIINLEIPVNDVGQIQIYDRCGDAYDMTTLSYSYSVDGACWSCYMSMSDVVESTLDSISDYFVRIKVAGEISSVTIGSEETTDYTTSLDSSFSLSSCETNSANQYNPYANIDCAIKLQQALANTVACTIGIPIYYFKVNGVQNSADMTFKEYALKSVTAVKQIKLIVTDGQMPSSKPEFADLGLDWQTDWETEILKSMFATAFGNTAQPTEGDLIYIPLMKRMWMVNEAYDERNDALMWQSTTWKVALVKYQSDMSLDLNEHDDFVDELVKNKYEDLFGDDEALSSGTESVQVMSQRPSNLYPVYKSDATRKELTYDTIDFQSTSLYHKGTLVMDNCYKFKDTSSQITYQRGWCGDELSISFIIRCNPSIYNTTLIKIGNIHVKLSQTMNNATLSLNVSDKCTATLDNDKWYFVCIRFSKTLHTADMTVAENKYPNGIPLYQLTSYHYYFDVDNATQVTAKWNEEMQSDTKRDVTLYGFNGNISNIKVMDVYDDKLSELMMQYPTHQHLLINDTARQIYGLLGSNPTRG